ncbi:hypothetical protein [Paraburkholderia sp. BL6669N2]|uniref:hypothetical protein n=1 Tax=Paraburkholderia sp. BL6669N2 TaxID=1938807 RepID=UPI001C6E9D0A|nr:hypothetical protein [Paraburkholderia sp. BL6669N2]
MAGFFGLIPRYRMKEYTRTAPTDGTGTNGRKDTEVPGFAGALEQVLRRFPDVRAYIHEQLERPAKTTSPAKIRYERIHAGVLKLLRPRLCDNEWPFCVSGRGYTAIARYCARYVKNNPRATDMARHGKATAEHRPFDPSKERLLPRFRFLQGLQLDYNLVDGADVFTIVLPNNTEVRIPVKRWHWGALICSSSGAAVGLHISLERAPTASSAMGVASSVVRSIRLKADDWQLTYTEDGKVLVNSHFPDLVGHGMAYIKLDRAWANTARDTITNLMDAFGCALNFGTVYCWYERDPVEGFFRRVSEIGAKATPMSYGTGPGDEKRFDPIKAAIKAGCNTEHLVALVIGSVAKINTSPTHALDGLTPVEAIGQALTNPNSGVFPMRAPESDRPEWFVCAERTAARVRNGKKVKRTSYVEKYGCVYHHPLLTASDKYVGERLLLYINRENANDVYAVVERTQEVLGLLFPEAHWAERPHSIRFRRALISFYRDRKADARLSFDPAQAMMQSVAAEALRDGEKTSPKTSEAALALARWKIETGVTALPFKKFRLIDTDQVIEVFAPVVAPRIKEQPIRRMTDDIDDVVVIDEPPGMDVENFELPPPTRRRKREDD